MTSYGSFCTKAINFYRRLIIFLEYNIFIKIILKQFLDALLADLQSTIQKSNKLNGGINGGYGSINGVRSRLPSANSPVVPSSDQPPEYPTVRTHKIERSTSNPSVQHELSVRVFVENIITY